MVGSKIGLLKKLSQSLESDSKRTLKRQMWTDNEKTDLVEVGKAVGVLAEPLVLSSESVSCSYFPELLQVDHIQGTTGDKQG